MAQRAIDREPLPVVRTGSGPTGFGGLKDAAHATELVEVVAARALLLPVAQRLATLFGFQTTHGGAMPVNRFSVRSDVVKSEAGSGEVPSNVANTVETLAALLGAASPDTLLFALELTNCIGWAASGCLLFCALPREPPSSSESLPKTP